MVNNILKTRNGVNVLLNRGSKATPDYTIPSTFKVSIDTSDVTWVDTSLSTTVPITGTESVDDCSVTTGWTASGSNSVAVNTVTFKPDGGTDGSLTLIKSDVSSATVSVAKTVTSLDGTSKDLLTWIYVIDAAALAKISSSSIRYGSDSSNYYLIAITLSVGWNFIKTAITSGFDSTVGSPVIGSLDYYYFDMVTNNATDTFSSGDIIFDSIRLASVDDYLKTIETDLIIDETDGSVSTISKLSVSEANGFLINGHGIFNTDSSPKMTDTGKFASYSKGTTDLFKFTNKVKLRNVNQT